MGFYLRKSVRVGPLRFNLSKSGIGVSAGVPGFRIGTGPRGTYVHMGRGGLYYRQTLSIPGPNPRQHQVSNSADSYSVQDDTHGPMNAICSGCVSQMVDSDSASLLAEIEQKRKRFRCWPAVVALAIFIAVLLLGARVTKWVAVPSYVLLIASAVSAYQYDQLKKSVVLMYDLEGPSLESYQLLHAAVEAIAECGAVWQITAEGDVYDPKYHAGASALISRNRISIGYRDPPYIKTNLPVPFFPFGLNVIYLLPDRALVFARDGVGAVDYASLNTSSIPKRFIEEGSVPFDAQVVDHTWRYVNKNGSPDRRFNNNRQIPICLYEELFLRSTAGIREILQFSRVGTSAPIESAIAEVAKSISDAEDAERERRREDFLKTQMSEKQDLESERSVRLSETGQGAVPPKPSPGKLYEALFNILCCIMVSDGRASESEMSVIADIMSKLKSGWSVEQCNQRTGDFIAEVRAIGYPAVLERSLNELPMFKASRRERTVIKCIELVAEANGKVVQQERDLCDRIAAELQ